MRYAVTLVFEVGPGKVPLGPDVLDGMRLPGRAVHRFSYCDGRSLTVIVDWSARDAGSAVADAVLGIRLVWSQLAGADPGEPLSARVRPLGRARVLAGLPAGAGLTPEAVGDVVLEDLPWIEQPRRGPRRDEPGDDEGGGLAGVREPRHPRPGPGHLSAALEEPRPLVL